MGFDEVYRYTGGKVDWFAAGWAREGRMTQAPYIGDLAQRDVPRCRPADTVAEVRRRLDGTQWDRCVVVDDGDMVAGILSGDRLSADGELAAELAMRPGPSTYRPSVPLREMLEHMRSGRLQNVLVTDADGVLIGALPRAVVESAAERTHAGDDGGGREETR